jgi:hypothetical protein
VRCVERAQEPGTSGRAGNRCSGDSTACESLSLKPRIPELLQTLLQQSQRYHLPIRVDASSDRRVCVTYDHHHLVLCYASANEPRHHGMPEGVKGLLPCHSDLPTVALVPLADSISDRLTASRLLGDGKQKRLLAVHLLALLDISEETQLHEL